MRHTICFAAAALFLFTHISAGQTTGPRYKTIELKDPGRIAGKVTWEGEIPKEAATEVPVSPAQQSGCRCRKVSVDRLKIDPKTKGLAECVVFIEKIEGGKPMPATGIDLMTGKPAVLDQIGCRYVPEVMVVTPGTQLLVTSSDNTPHNVNARMGADRLFNLQIPLKGAKAEGPETSVGTKPGVISLACNAGHPWMSGYIHVAAHPYYAVTDREGRFELRDVPPGRYKLVCWHGNWTPRLLRDTGGNVSEVQYSAPVEVTREVKVEPGKPAEVAFTLSIDSARPRKR